MTTDEPSIHDLEPHIMGVDWQCPECAATVRAGDLDDLVDRVRAHRRDDCRPPLALDPRPTMRVPSHSADAPSG